MSAEQQTKAETDSIPVQNGSRPGGNRSRRAEQRNLWLSRVSFLVSGVALVSVGYRSVARRLSDASPEQAIAAVTAPVAPQAQPAAQANVAPAPVAEIKVETPFASRVQNSLKQGLAALKIKRLVVTQAVEDREPVAADVVDAETPVIAFVEVASGSTEDQHVVVTFEHETGDRVGLVNLSVPGNKPRWRTWGRTYNVNRDGRWIAVVRDAHGEELGRTEFTVRRSG